MRTALFAALLGLAACAEASSPGAPGAAITDPAALFPSGGAWAVTAIEGRPVPAGVHPTLMREGGRVGGNAGCNQFGGPVRIAGRRLSFGQMASTLMGCEPPAMTVEGALHAALMRVDGVSGLPGGTLQLTAQGAPVVTLAPLAPTGG